MILNWHTDPDFAEEHEVVDAATGEPLPDDLDFFYADDETQTLRTWETESPHVFALDEHGKWIPRELTGVQPFRIVRKSEAELAEIYAWREKSQQMRERQQQMPQG